MTIRLSPIFFQQPECGPGSLKSLIEKQNDPLAAFPFHFSPLPLTFSQHVANTGGSKYRKLPIDQSGNRIQVQAAGAVSRGSWVVRGEVILKTSAAGSNYARTTQCLAVFGQSDGQHRLLKLRKMQRPTGRTSSWRH